MREILFRGKRVDNGEWVYGGILQTENWTSIFTYKDYQGSINEPPSCDVEDYEVDPSSVGQYTGLLDKNGKKIFEGDIVQIEDFSHGCALNYKQPTSKWAVKWYEDTAKFSIDYMKVLNFNFTKSEVIGNIHDNPELLKGE